VPISDLNRLQDYGDRRHHLGHYIADQLKAANTSIETLGELGLIGRAGNVDYNGYNADFGVLGDKGRFEGVGVGGYTQAQIPPGVYTLMSVRVLQNLKQFIEIPITIWVIIALRRLFNEPIDVMLGLEYLPTNYGGSEILRNLRGISLEELTHLTGLDYLNITKIDNFSVWAYDNKAGNIETPAGLILEQLNGDILCWDVLVKMRNILEINIDDLLGMCYNK
jgi:hypothetical protein